MRHGLVEKQVTRHGPHRVENDGIADALLDETLHHALARTLRGHAYAGHLHGSTHSASSSTTACAAMPSPRPM